MGKLILLLAAFVTSFSINSQKLSDEAAILGLLRMDDIGGKYQWNFQDSSLKKLAIEKLIDPSTVKTKKGISLLSFGFTSQTYDHENDPIFLKHTLLRTSRPDSLFDGAEFISNHFLKSDYSAFDLALISFYVDSKSILYWNTWTPYYLSFLGIKNIDTTLIFLKSNIDAINQLHYALYNIVDRYDTLDINVCLARIGKLSDTLVVSQIDERFKKDGSNDYLKYFEKLSRIRTQYSFQKIGNYLIADLNEISSTTKRKNTQQMALAAYLAYVKNFPDRSTKWQDTFNLWTMVRYSKIHGKDYSTDEYMEMARNWYILNKDNLVLDYDKF